MQTNVACTPKRKREFCRDHNLTFLCSSLLQTDQFLNKKMKFGGKKISNNNFRTITQGLLSFSFAFLLPDGLRFSAYSFSVYSQSTIILNEINAVKGRAWHACDPNTDDWGPVSRVRVYGQVAPSPPFL